MRYMLALFLTVVFIHPAHAACTSPAGAASQTRYDFTANKMYYCNNTDWVEMGGAAGGGDVPAGTLCGFAWKDAGQCTNNSGWQSIRTCLGVNITSACPSGYTDIRSPSHNFGSFASPEYVCQRWCAKN